MKDSRVFLLFWLINSALFYVAPLIFRDFMITGNLRLSPFMASIISGFLLTVADAVTQPIFASLKIKISKDWQWILSFLFVNIIGIWLIARYADLTGVGIISAWMATLMGAIFTLIQWVGEKLLLKNK